MCRHELEKTVRVEIQLTCSCAACSEQRMFELAQQELEAAMA